MEVIVVGGGVIGLASSYYLNQQGVDVTLFEKGSLGSGNTERSAGGIRYQFSSPVNIQLSKISITLWKQFKETFGSDIAYRQPGYLFVGRSEQAAQNLKQNVALQQEHDIPSEYLTPREAAERCPGLRSEAISGASYCAEDGFADPHLALQALSQAAETTGVEIQTHTEVIDLVRDSGNSRRIIGVETPDGRKTADHVINAGGAWAGKIAAMADISLPLAPRRIQIAVIDPETPIPESLPMVLDPEQECYFRPEREGLALVGGGTSLGSADAKADPNSFSKSLDMDYGVEALERVAELADYFGPESKIRDGWAGLYVLTPDHIPIIEETVPGLINVVGFSGHGFMHAPAAGKLVADLAINGKTSRIDASQLSSDRFDAVAGLDDEKDIVI